MRKARFYDFGPFRIDRADRILLCKGAAVQLTPKVFDTLLALVENSKRLVEKGDLMEAVWPDSFVAESSLTFNISILRKALAEHDDRQYIETVPRRGYRFVAEVTESPKEQTSAEKEEAGQALTEAAPKTIAILPFRSLIPDIEYQYLGLGMADVLITRLGSIKKLLVRPTSAIVKYDNLEQDPILVGHELGVDTVLEGTIRRLGERLRVTVQLVDVQKKSPVWAEKLDEKFTDIFAVEDSIAEKLTPALMLTLNAEEIRQIKRRFTESAEAYHAYLKGRYYWNKQTPEGLQKSVEHFERAIATDPNYAPAYAGLADAYNLIGTWGGVAPTQVLPRAKALAQRAIEIDETIAEAHSALGGAMAMYDWDWPGSEKEFKRAIELNPGYATAHHAYAMAYLLPLGRLDDALAEIKHAQELDPVSLFINASAGMVLNYMGKYDEAIEQLERVLELEPNYYLSHWCLGYGYEGKGCYKEAIEAYQKARILSGGSSSTTRSLGHLYAVLGKKEEARTLLNELEEASRHNYVSPYDIAGIYAGLGEESKAIEWLKKACREHAGALVWLKIDNTFKSFRSEPRFRELLEQINLGG
ncbi:MAG TPA: tetratricopeptide repeat protein [Blastocatellia bacterium]|nr:tetratricopeptide repeat protein [Blastocatellia bacterium]